jgi:uncharacterized protein (DUF427 family)
MEAKSIKLPGPNHPITIEPNSAHVIVSVAGHIVADTQQALAAIAGHVAFYPDRVNAIEEPPRDLRT